MNTRKCARCGKPFKRSKDYPLGGPVFNYRDDSWPTDFLVYAHGYCKAGDGFQHPLQPNSISDWTRERYGI